MLAGGIIQCFSESSQRLTEAGKTLLHLLPRCHTSASLRTCSRKWGSLTSRKSIKSTVRKNGTSVRRSKNSRARSAGDKGGSHHKPTSMSELPVASPRAKDPNKKTKHFSGGTYRKMMSKMASFHSDGNEIGWVRISLRVRTCITSILYNQGIVPLYC